MPGAAHLCLHPFEKRSKAALPEIGHAGFRGSDCSVFIGEEGSKLLDKSGEHRDIVGLCMFQYAVCDEEELFHKFEKTLKTGGAVVAILTEDDAVKQKTIVEILKSHHARKINYWGKWHFDALG